MTDNEIIEALECCTNPNGNDCYQCPKWVQNYETTTECGIDLMADAINLITRQKAEIERLKKVNDIRLECLGRSRAKAKAEAIKEFAKMLRANKIKGEFAQRDDYYVNVINIDQLEEMVVMCDGT